MGIVHLSSMELMPDEPGQFPFVIAAIRIVSLAGGGSLHERTRVLAPEPHLTLHADHGDHSDQYGLSINTWHNFFSNFAITKKENKLEYHKKLI